MPKEKDAPNFEFEIKFYERVLKESPDFIEALIALGDLYTKAGFYEQGLAVDLKLSQLRPDDPIIFYNLTCSQSLLNKIDEAFMSLSKAINLGYKDWSFMSRDTDLENLRRDSRFAEFLDKAQDKKRLKSKAS